MDPRYHWPQQAQGYPNGQYAQPMQPNGYPPATNTFQPAPQQPMMPGYPVSHSSQNHPRVVIPPRPGQPSPNNNPYAPYRPPQPAVVIPGRTPSQGGMGQPYNPKIRQVQVPMQRTPQIQRAGSGASPGHARPPQSQTHSTKPVQGSQSHQENMHRLQQRTSSGTSTNHSQHRSPLQSQAAAKQRTSSSQPSSRPHGSPSLPQTPLSQGRSHPQVVIKKSAPSVSVQENPQRQTPKALPTDLSVLLLSAADEYIAAARSMGSVAAMAQRQADLQQYYKLTATGLGCMEAVLKNYNQAPRDEAMLRLRYASLLVEETNNDVEIEDVLTKGVALCSRCRLLDLKYSMQHLYARYQFQTNHRAAMKTLDGHISETETFKHIPWIYAFRFLKVSLALQIPGRPEIASALHQLRAIAGHANRQGDRAIFVTCHAFEAIIHLRTPGADHHEQANRAIAAARSLQLQTSASQLGQVAALIDCVDIACSLQQGQPDKRKMTELQEKVDHLNSGENGSFSVLIEKSFGGNITATTSGIFTKSSGGQDELVFAWLPRKDLKLLAYYLSGVTSLAHDSKGPDYLKEGLKVTQDALQRPSSLPMSIPASVHQKNWLATLDWHLRFTLGLVACRTEDMVHTNQALISLRSRLSHAPFSNGETSTRMVEYLSGVYDQSRGSMESALATYESPLFNIPEAGTHTDFRSDLAIIATMNRLLILGPDHFLSGILFSQLEPICSNHSNLYISSAFKLIRAITAAPNDSINRQKTLIQNAIQSSEKLRHFRNFQFVTICLNYMASRFFADGFHESAIKSVRAARSMARQNQNTLWRAVALGLCMHTFQRNGFVEDAMASQKDFEDLWKQLPGPLRKELTGSVPMNGFISGDGDIQMHG